MKWRALAVLLLLALSSARPALARDLRQPAGSVDPAALEQRLLDQARAFRRWRWAWAGIYTALTVGNLALVPGTARADRIDLYTGAVTSAVGIPPVFLLSQPALGVPPCSVGRLACAQAKLDEVAEFQRAARAWPAHVITVAVNAAAGAFLGFGYHRWRPAALAFVLGTAIGEVQIFTHPRGALP